MPRSIQEILDHANELAKRFEDYEPDPADERSVEEYLLDAPRSHEREANVRSSTPSLRHGRRTSRGSESANSSVPQHRLHSSATAQSSKPADTRRVYPSDRCRSRMGPCLRSDGDYAVARSRLEAAQFAGYVGVDARLVTAVMRWLWRLFDQPARR